MPSHESDAAVPARDGRPLDGPGIRRPSVGDVLASCSAATAVSTPPEPAEDLPQVPEDEPRPDAA